MTKDSAIATATHCANTQGITILVYRDPIGCGEQEGFDTPWMYAPYATKDTIAPHREKEHDTVIKPE